MARLDTRSLTPAESVTVRSVNDHLGRCTCPDCAAADAILSSRAIASDTAHPLHATVRSQWEPCTN